MFQPIKSLNLAGLNKAHTNVPEQPVNSIANKCKKLKYVHEVKSVGILIEEEWENCISVPSTKTAWDLYLEENDQLKISTTIEELDFALNGGLVFGQINEFSGKTGAGKTQICFQICINHLLHQPTSEVLYISTNSNFSIDRVKELIKLALDNQNTLHHDMSILNRLNVLQTCDLTELLAIGSYLEKWVCSHQIAVLVIDSIFMLFKTVPSKGRRVLIYRFISNLQKVARKNNFTVIFTNNLSKQSNEQGEEQFPAYLGENYYHRITKRILLTKLNDGYEAKIEKGSFKEDNEVGYVFKI